MLDMSGDKTPPCGTPAINVTGFEDSPKQINEWQVPDATTYASGGVADHGQVEVASLRARAILQLHPRGASRMIKAAFRTEAVASEWKSLSQIGCMAISIGRWTIRSSRI